MRGEISSGRHSKRHPYDWYVEQGWETWQLFQALGGFAQELDAGEIIWDPAAGFGHVAGPFVEAGFDVWLSDIVNRVAWADFEHLAAYLRPQFFSADFLERERTPMQRPCSIVCNPPYSYIKGIAEAFARQALWLATRRVCMLVPNKWLASKGRFRLFMVDYPPLAVLHLCERPSMPPGDMIEAMAGRAYRGGMIDYCWVVWDKTRPTTSGFTRTIWLPALSAGHIAPIEGVA